MPSALARLSRCFQTLAGNRTERGMVGPVSVPFLGLPRPALMAIPSRAIRRVYGLRRTLALSKFTSGIWRSEARDDSRGFLPVTFCSKRFLSCDVARLALMMRIALGLLDEDREANKCNTFL